MKKLKEGETLVVAIIVPFALVLFLAYEIIVHDWLDGASIGGTVISDLMLQIAVILMVFSSSVYLIMRYAGEEDILCKYHISLEVTKRN